MHTALEILGGIFIALVIAGGVAAGVVVFLAKAMSD